MDEHHHKPFAKEKLTRGRPKSDAKKQAMLDAATTLFLEKGFDGTSMDEVARIAHVSKQTVYTHFSSKEGLFSAAIKARLKDVYPNQSVTRAKAPTVEAALLALANDIVRLVLSPDAIALVRLMAAVAGKSNSLVELFWASGPSEIEEQLTDLIRGWRDEGSLQTDDSELAAADFLALLRGDLQFRWAIGLIDGVTEDQIRAHTNHCVALFMRMYGKA